MKPPNESGDHVAAVAARMKNRAKTEKPDVLGELSIWLKNQWLRHYILFSGLANEADRMAMAQLWRFIEAIKEVRK